MVKILRIIVIIILMLQVFGRVNSSTESALTVLPDSWKFAVVSDTQNDNWDISAGSCVNPNILTLIAVDISVQMPEFVIVCGDLVNGWLRHNGKSYREQYMDWMAAMAPVLGSGIRVFTVRGNHDAGPELYVVRPLCEELDLMPGSLEQLKQAYIAVIADGLIPFAGPEGEEGLTWSFGFRDACFIGLDQYTGRQHLVNQDWLDKRLAANDRTHLFIFGHEPAFRADYRDNLSFFPAERNRFWDSIAQSGAGIYFCGHDHFYNRAVVPDSKGNSVRQIVCGTGGGDLQRWSGRYGERKRVKGEFHNNEYFGYVMVTVEGPVVTVQWKALVDPENSTWQVLDEFSYSAGRERTESGGYAQNMR